MPTFLDDDKRKKLVGSEIELEIVGGDKVGIGGENWKINFFLAQKILKI